MQPDKLYIGTCSWKYPEWDIYPPGSDPKKYNFLRDYAAHFNAVEIDQWFWSLYAPEKVRLPSRNDVEQYAASVPEHFRFLIKAPNAISLTHFYSTGQTAKQYPDLAGTPNPHFLGREITERFLASLRPMKGKIGMIMFEFEYLNKQKMSGAAEFIERLEPFLRDLPADLPFGIEIRNPNYITPRFAELLRRHGTTYVVLQGYYMPPVWEVERKIDLRAPGPFVIRLHGPDRSGIEKLTGGIWNRLAIDRREELERIVAIIRSRLAAGDTVYANVNNHFEGCAPLTIRRVQELLESD